ncbi:ultraviolet-B receptor UVR8-like [Hibiscus syriacus]|uniref:ultraviolet-B receptor UVR8-like n=1 Tax=Hibiscus syriacus TaxID=106335 RepID=UPI0019233F13|nr:ultraviolet-B receptor UVR8-like [Hibiscus syriacus]
MASSFSSSVIAWGSGEDGQLGIGNNEEREWACVVQALEPHNVRSVVAGSRNSLAICDDGKVSAATPPSAFIFIFFLVLFEVGIDCLFSCLIPFWLKTSLGVSKRASTVLTWVFWVFD